MKEIEVDFSADINADKVYLTEVGELFNALYKPLCNYAYSFVKDIDDSEDIVQGVFYYLWKNRKTSEIKGPVKSYLFSAVRNNSLKKLNREKLKNRYKENILHETQRNSDDTMTKLTNKELEEQIKKAIEELPEQCRLIFKLSRIGGMKYAEIAENLELSVKTVENQMGKALKVLREKLKHYLAAQI